MADRNLLALGQPYADPANPLARGTPTWADAYDYNAPIVGQHLADAAAAAQTPQFWTDAGHQYVNALLMGTTAPGMRGGASLDNPAFAKWFGKSQIVNDAGHPAVVYHGTRAPQPFSEFSQQGAEATGRWTQDEGADVGFHFSPEKETASIYGNVGNYHIKMEKPLRVSEKDVRAAQDEWLSGLENSENPEHRSLADFITQTDAFDNPGSGYYNYGLGMLTREAKAQGHDGAIFTRQRDFTDERPINEYIVFNPKNIRQADPTPVTKAP